MLLSKKNIFELIFFNKGPIHNNLYQEDNYIEIISEENSKSLKYCFFLSLLINDTSYLNYIYNIKYIQDIFKIMEEKENSLIKIIFSKIICDLIYYYKETEKYKEEEEEEELTQKLDICDKNINNIDTLGLGLAKDDIKNNNIEIIYSKIIFYFLKNNNFEDYEKTYDFLDKLKLGEINITQNLMKDLLIIFEKENEILNKYKICEIDDLKNIEKINFYYFLFKFILKNDIYLYQIPFLLKIKKNILKFVKSGNDISHVINNKIKKFILKFFIGEEYNIVLKTKNIFTKTISTIFIEVEDEDNDDNDPLFQNAGKQIWVKILKNCTLVLNMGSEFIYDFSEIVYKNNNKNVKINYKTFNLIKQNEIYKKQKYFEDFKFFTKFLENIKIILNKEFENYEGCNIVVKIEFETTFYDGFPNIQCKYTFSPDNKKTLTFSDLNLIYNNYYEDFNSLIKEISIFLKNTILFNNVELFLLEYDISNNLPQVEEDIQIYNNGYKDIINNNM